MKIKDYIHIATALWIVLLAAILLVWLVTSESDRGEVTHDPFVTHIVIIATIIFFGLLFMSFMTMDTFKVKQS